MTTQKQTESLQGIIAAWETQQEAYVHHREQRFEIVLDALENAAPQATNILDIGGGLGSFSHRILTRFPQAHVATLDYDPALLELARFNLKNFTTRWEAIDANLLCSDWSKELNGFTPDVVVSSTALHWLPTGRLVSLYEEISTLLSPGGIFVNADHFPSPDSGSFFHRAAEADDAQQQSRFFSKNAASWDQWWSALEKNPGFADLVAKRAERFTWPPHSFDTTVELHKEALRASRFREVGTLWQYFDDYVVYAVR